MSLSEIIKQQTKDGETVVSFLQNVMEGDLEGFKEGHRIRAAELLTRFGHEEARAYIREYSQPASPDDDPTTRSRDTRFDKALAKAIKQDTGDGRYVSRFLLNLVDGDLRSFNKGHRIRAAAELMVRLEGIVVGYTSTRNSPKRPKAAVTRPTPVRVMNTPAPAASVPAPDAPTNSAASGSRIGRHHRHRRPHHLGSLGSWIGRHHRHRRPHHLGSLGSWIGRHHRHRRPHHLGSLGSWIGRHHRHRRPHQVGSLGSRIGRHHRRRRLGWHADRICGSTFRP